MRLDWFLPSIRRTKPDAPAKRRHWIVERARHTLPPSWRSNWTTKERGFVRRFLRQLGSSWLASPLRRLVQSISFVSFLVLFFVVCWPYDARPAKEWQGWIPLAVDTDSGSLTVQPPLSMTAPLRKGQVLWLSEESPADSPAMVFGRFRIDPVDQGSYQLVPVSPLSEEMRANLALSPGPWQISEGQPGRWPSHYADQLAKKEWVEAEFFLVIDPLVSLSTALATRSWVGSLISAGLILFVCLVVPRGFCGYLCPLGTLIDIVDSILGKRITRFRVPDNGWWVHLKYYLLLAILVSALCGVLISGYFAAIPVITRGLLFCIAPLPQGWFNGWHQVPPMGWGQVLSITLFGLVLALGLLKPRFWCKYVCPSGAVFSLGNLFRVTERKVETSCIHCRKCIEICPFDAIKADFTTRVTDCTLCQSCGGVCPTHAIKFVDRWEIAGLKAENDPPTGETLLGRRGFVSASVGIISAMAAGSAAAGLTKAFGIQGDTNSLPIRPPGSVPEDQFLQQCIRCGECFKVCPSDVLQPLGFQQGIEGLWTPQVVPDWAGCASSCNACGQVCPTGAIVPLALDEKRQTRIGLAFVDENTCLPMAGREACQLCVDECHHAGYDAIEFTQVRTRLDEEGNPIEGSGFLAPFVIADRCVGCGLCQTRCFGINVSAKKLLESSAIVVRTGPNWEDRPRPILDRPPPHGS